MSDHSIRRNFHTIDSAYSLPNDAPEHGHLEAQDAPIVAMLGGRTYLTSLAPDQPPSSVEDVSCGICVVAARMATSFPSAEVTSLDLSPVHEDLRAKPPNVRYVQGDIMGLASKEDAISFKPATFDFVFSRMLVAGTRHWPAYTRTAFSLLRPGGWFERQEIAFRWHSVDEQGNEAEISSQWSWLYTIQQRAMDKSIDLLAGEKLVRIGRRPGSSTSLSQSTKDVEFRTISGMRRLRSHWALQHIIRERRLYDYGFKVM